MLLKWPVHFILLSWLNYFISHVNYEPNSCEQALVGASVAALTIYDMVKAISHNVQIEGTELVSKTGGKSDIVYDNI